MYNLKVNKNLIEFSGRLLWIFYALNIHVMTFDWTFILFQNTCFWFLFLVQLKHKESKMIGWAFSSTFWVKQFPIINLLLIYSFSSIFKLFPCNDQKYLPYLILYLYFRFFVCKPTWNISKLHKSLWALDKQIFEDLNWPDLSQSIFCLPLTTRRYCEHRPFATLYIACDKARCWCTHFGWHAVDICWTCTGLKITNFRTSYFEFHCLKISTRLDTFSITAYSSFIK